MYGQNFGFWQFLTFFQRQTYRPTDRPTEKVGIEAPSPELKNSYNIHWKISNRGANPDQMNWSTLTSAHLQNNHIRCSTPFYFLRCHFLILTSSQAIKTYSANGTHAQVAALSYSEVCTKRARLQRWRRVQTQNRYDI